MSIAKTLVLFLGSLIFLSAAAVADWPCRTDSLVPVVTNSGNQWNVHLVSDAKQGALLIWQDRRGGTTDKLYMQRLDSKGSALWTPGGIPLASSPGYQYYPQIVSDGDAGSFVVWQDNRYGVDYDIFLQKVSPDGTPLWIENGVLVCNAGGHQYNPQIIRDSFNDLIVLWQDRRKGNFDIYAQKFNSLGQPLWSPNGEAVCSAAGDQLEPKVVPDGQGGALIAWTDYRSGTGTSDIYMQHMLSGGQSEWAVNGIPVCSAPNSQLNVQLVSDGSGGGIAAWQDRRSGSYDNIYAQSINSSGQVRWTDDGIPLAFAVGVQYYPQMVEDGFGGAIVTWQDNRRGSDYDIYAQSVDKTGQLLWTSAGKVICGSLGHQYNPQLVRQGSTVIISWQDKRSGDFNIYGQGLSLNGEMLWATDGVEIAEAPLDQFLPQMASDGVHGAIVAFPDYHLGTGTVDIYAHRIGANGKPAGGCYRTFSQDSLSMKAVRIRRTSRELRKPTVGNVRDQIFANGGFSQGIVLGVERTDSVKRYGWIYFTKSYYTRKALPQNGKSRPFDRIYDRSFLGRLKNPSHFRYNNSLSGELLALKMNIAASDVGITEPYFGNLIYRDTASAGSLLNGLTLRSVTGRVDTMLTYYKRYSGVDWNYIDFSLRRINRAFEGALDTISTNPLKITSVKSLFAVSFLVPNPDPPPPLPVFITQPEETDIPDNFTLYQNYPNPFNPLTTFEFVLPEPALVTVKIYNMLGQQVDVLFNETEMEDGHQVIDYDGSRLSSGVYFYRVTANPVSNDTRPMTLVKKMMLIK